MSDTSIILLYLLLGHVIGDFVLQSQALATAKRTQARSLALHIGLVLLAHIVTLIPLRQLLSTWSSDWFWVLPAVVLAHAAIDAGKAAYERRFGETLATFAIDQALHVSCLVIAADMLAPATSSTPIDFSLRQRVAVVAIAYIICTLAGSAIVRLVLARYPLQPEEPNEPADPSPARMGHAIGVLERSLGLTFILLDSWTRPSRHHHGEVNCPVQGSRTTPLWRILPDRHADELAGNRGGRRRDRPLFGIAVMTAASIYLFVVLLLALVSFYTQRLRPDVTALLVMLSLLLPWQPTDGGLSSILTPGEAFHGFGSPALLMVASMFVLSAAMVRTGAAQMLGGQLLRRTATSELRFQLTVLTLVTAFSAIVNDTTTVLVWMPPVMAICRERGYAPSRILMLLAFASLLGGKWTLIGTRSNVILSDYLLDRTGEGLAFFRLCSGWRGGVRRVRHVVCVDRPPLLASRRSAAVARKPLRSGRVLDRDDGRTQFRSCRQDAGRT